MLFTISCNNNNISEKVKIQENNALVENSSIEI